MPSLKTVKNEINMNIITLPVVVALPTLDLINSTHFFDSILLTNQKLTENKTTTAEIPTIPFNKSLSIPEECNI